MGSMAHRRSERHTMPRPTARGGSGRIRVRRRAGRGMDRLRAPCNSSAAASSAARTSCRAPINASERACTECSRARAVRDRCSRSLRSVQRPKERRNEDKRAFQDRVAAMLPNVEKVLDVVGPIVVDGDLNVVEPAHDPRYAVFGIWEYDFYQAFGRAGFEDAFRIMEPVKMDYSWFGRPSAEGRRNGYRFDHAFVSGAHRAAVVECRYDHSARTAGLTDHSALILTLDVSATVE